MGLEFFLNVTRNDHRLIRDLLQGLMIELFRKESEKAVKLLEKLDEIAGPHFRFEEESVYPAMIQFFGDLYVNKLFTDHDLVIARAKKIHTALHFKILQEEDYNILIDAVASMLPHVSDCEGLGIMIKKLSRDEVEFMMKSLENSRRSDLSLIEWSDSIRNRNPLFIL